jgi:signal transduction histidine kinase
MARVRRLLAVLCTDGVSESAERYWRLHQAEASGQVRDLEATLKRVSVAEITRAESWREAAHDIRGTFGSVELATLLVDDPSSAQDRQENIELLKQNVSSMRDMLNELLDLARLEAGQDSLEVTPFDSSTVLMKLSDNLLPLARAKGLFLRATGPESLPVNGDRRKVVRIVQNLLINALKYTTNGGVTLTWKEGQDDHWWVTVTDTGPGFAGDSGKPIRRAIEEASDRARELDANDNDSDGTDLFSSTPIQSTHESIPGEGIGLSIVKRLCELLNAVLEIETEMGAGSSFRIRFPRHYSTRLRDGVRR